jgi:hypothetical protein
MIAFLFLTRSLPHKPELWKKFFDQCKDRSEYTIAIHAMNVSEVAKHPFWAQHLIPESKRVVNASRNKFSLVQAMNALLETTWTKTVDKFVFLSESTIPIRSFYDCARLLRASPNSSMGRGWDSVNHTSRRRYNSLNHRRVWKLKPREFFKTTQWVVLNNACAKYIITNRHVHDPVFLNSMVPD